MRGIGLGTSAVATLLCGAMPGHAQLSQWRTKAVDERPTFGNANDSQQLAIGFAKCVVQGRHAKAAAMVLEPLGSEAQQRALKQIIIYQDPCFNEADMQFRMSSLPMAGAMASALLLQDHPDAVQLLAGRPAAASDPARITAAEEFGRCVSLTNPAGVMRLLVSRPGSPAEIAAVNALAPALGPCLARGSTIKLDYGFVRNVTAVAFNRLVVEQSATAAAVR